MTDGKGTPLALVHTGANRPDHESVEALLSQFKDSAYAMSPCYKAMYSRKMEDKIIVKGVESSKGLGKIRYTIERTFAWCDGYRKIRLRDARQLLTWDALHHVAFICITFKQIMNLC